MIVVTEALYVGTPQEAAKRDNTFYTHVFNEATHAIDEGYTVFIPADGWELLAEAILEHFGATKERVADAIQFARTGSFVNENRYAW